MGELLVIDFSSETQLVLTWYTIMDWVNKMKKSDLLLVTIDHSVSFDWSVEYF